MKRGGKKKNEVTQQSVAGISKVSGRKHISAVGILSILAITLLVYWPSIHNRFISEWDDNEYVCKNQTVLGDNISFSKLNLNLAGNWQPGVILQLWAEHHLFGLKSIDQNAELQPASTVLGIQRQPTYDGTPYHLVSLVMHLFNALFLFLFFSRFCKSLVPEKDIPIIALIGTLIFSLHPMHVESVAWISETKDLGYALWYHAALWMFCVYLDKGLLRYLFITGLFFALSVLYKAQGVTLPLALMLVAIVKNQSSVNEKVSSWSEKLLKWGKSLRRQEVIFFGCAMVISLAVGKLAIDAQAGASALGHDDIANTPLFDRMLFIGYGLGNYLLKFVIPFNLSIFHQYPLKTDGMYDWHVYLIALVPVLIIAILWRLRANLIVVFSIVYFFIHILPVSQILAVGSSNYWERYTYVSYDGLCLLAATLIVYYYQKQRIMTVGIAGSLLLFFIYSTFERALMWHDNETLFLDTIKKNPDIGMFKGWIGLAFFQEGKFDEAKKYLDGCIAINQAVPQAYVTRAHLYVAGIKPDMAKETRLVLLDSAINGCKASLVKENDSSNAFGGLGVIYSMKGDLTGQKSMFDSARIFLLDALEFHGDDSAEICQNIGHSYNNCGEFDSALVWYSRALKGNSGLWPSYVHRGYILYKKGKPFWKDALKDFKVAEEHDPDPANRSVAQTYIKMIGAD